MPSIAPVAPPALIYSVLATLLLCSPRVVVVPPVHSTVPFLAGLRMPSCSAQAPPTYKDLLRLPLFLGASSLPGAVPPDALLLYLAVVPLAAAPATCPALGPAEVQHYPWDGDTEVASSDGSSARLASPLCLGLPPSTAGLPVHAVAGSEEKYVMVPLHRCYSRLASASACTSAVVIERGPAVTAASCASSEVLVIDNDGDDDTRSGSGAVLRCSPPAPCASRTPASCLRIPLWLLAGTPLPALGSQGPAVVGGNGTPRPLG